MSAVFLYIDLTKNQNQNPKNKMKNIGTHLLSALAGALLGFFGQSIIIPTTITAPAVVKTADSVVVKTFNKADTTKIKKADTLSVKPKH